MERKIERTLSWRHRPFPELARLSWPIAVSTLSYSVMTLVGTLFVGQLGASALAGVSLGGVAAFTVLCFGFGVLRGVKVLVSQAVGGGDRTRVGTWLWTGLSLALGLGVVMVIVGRAIAPELHRLAASAAAGTYAEQYLSVRVLGAPLVLAYVALREHRYGIGDTRSAMVGAIVGNLVNILLDWIFVLVLGLGVAGAAWSTVCAHAVELSVLVVVQTRIGWPRFRVRLRDVSDLLSVGLPTGVQFWLEVGSFAVLTTIVSSLGERQLAAHQIALSIVHFSFLPTMALSEAASVLAGQAVGAGEVRLVRRVARTALLCALIYTGVCTVVLVAGGALITGAFTADAALASTAVSLLWIAALFQMADGAAMVARGVLRGTGDVRFPAVVGIACAWSCTPTLAYLLGKQAGLGALGGWIGISVEIITAAVIFWWRLERNGWVASARRSRARTRAQAALAIA